MLVSSAKGGVGKSTVAANLAVSLRDLGYQVGLADCDVHGPSQHNMFGIDTTAAHSDHDPVVSHGVSVNTMALRVAAGKTIAWRGPMLKVAVLDLLMHTHWGELDYLVVDMPPGTGDIQLAICEKLPEATAVIVTTPQTVATIDTVRGMDLYRSAGIEIAGIVENMCGFVCGHCGETEYIFGQGGAKELAQQHGVPFLAEIPIHTEIRRGGDSGTPVVHSNSHIQHIYRSIAAELTGHTQ